VRPKRDLLRIVRRPDGSVAIDDSGRLAGRGAYVCRDQACRDLAMTKGALARALRTPIPSALRDTLAGGNPEQDEGGARGQE
jgi:predicted RNA-binding protein YlxR (DUF448 family)